jgi:Ca2+-binding RTX toxin-like protein
MSTPVLGPEFTVNTTTTGSQMHATVAATADGRFAIAWRNENDYAMRVFHADGTPDGPERPIDVGGASPLIDNRIEMVGMPNDDLAVAYLDTTVNDGDILLRFYHSTPQSFGYATFDQHDVSVDHFQPEAGLEDSIGLGVDPASGTVIVEFYEVQPSGNRLRSELPYIPFKTSAGSTINSEGNFSQMEGVVVNGEFENTFRDNSTGNVLIFSGAPSEVIGPGTNPYLAHFNNGNYALVRQDNGSVLLRIMNFASFPSDFGSDIVVAGSPSAPASDSHLLVLQDDRLLVVWEQTIISGQTSSDLVSGRLYNPDGTPESGIFAIDQFNFPTGGQPVTGAPRAAQLADGRVVVTYQDGTLTDADIRAHIIDVRNGAVTLAGTVFGDDHVGTALGDTFLEGRGDDHVAAGGGDDVLNGGADSDTLLGEDGNDTLIGGLGDDILFGGPGSDTFRFDSPFEGTGPFGGVDSIRDFTHGRDHILLGTAFVSEGGGPHPLGASVHFQVGSAATAAGPTLLMDNFNNHTLSWDADGNGPAAPNVLTTVGFADTNAVIEPDATNYTLPGLNGYSVLGTGDFNANGGQDSDIVLRNNTSGAAEIWFMGGGHIIGDYPIGNLAGYGLAGTGDFNHDGTDDLLWRNNTSGVVETWLMHDGARVGGDTLGNLTGYTALGTGDFNQDGNTDIVWQNNASGAVDIWFMGGGHPVADYNIGNLSGYSLLGIGDFNGDHTSDFVWRNNMSGVTETWLMQQGAPTGGSTIGNLAGYQLLETGDLNHDGTDDLVWRASTGATSTWVMHEGQFQNETENLGTVPLENLAAASGDFTGDGGKDVLFMNSATNTTTIMDIEHHSLTASDFLIV